MARLSRTFILMSLLAAAACGGSDDPSPPSSPPPSGSGDTVTGRERFGWTQAGSVSDAGVLQFAVYVDGARRVLEGATCAAGSGSGLDCSAPLPSLTAGRHTLELAAFYASGDTITEGPKSTPLQLTVASVTASSGASAIAAAPPPPASGHLVASDGSALQRGGPRSRSARPGRRGRRSGRPQLRCGARRRPPHFRPGRLDDRWRSRRRSLLGPRRRMRWCSRSRSLRISRRRTSSTS